MGSLKSRRSELTAHQLAECSPPAASQPRSTGSARYWPSASPTCRLPITAAAPPPTRAEPEISSLGLVNYGVLMAPRAMGGLSAPIGQEEIQRFLDAADTVVADQSPRWNAAS